jgi:hypothetical protein
LANSFNRFGITVYAILKNPKDKWTHYKPFLIAIMKVNRIPSCFLHGTHGFKLLFWNSRGWFCETVSSFLNWSHIGGCRTYWKKFSISLQKCCDYFTSNWFVLSFPLVLGKLFDDDNWSRTWQSYSYCDSINLGCCFVIYW